MVRELTCPRCQQRLERTASAHGVFWSCSSCTGKALGVDLLRRTFARDQVNALWRRAQSNEGPQGTACPSCRNAMVEVAATTEPQPCVDVCKLCHFVWFDAQELARFTPLPPPPKPESELSPEARKAIAIFKVEAMAREQEREFGGDPPDEMWKTLVAVFGMPVEIESPNELRTPWLTWSIATVMAAVMVLTFRDLESAIRAWGLVPAEFARHSGTTFVSSFFLHGGVMHVLSNLYFLLVFGDDVEVHLGWWRYLLLVAIATVVGDVCHIVLNPGSTIPVIGASGGISGLIAYYGLKYPRARLAMGIFRLGYTRWFRFPAWVALGLWLALQIIAVREQIGGFTNVSAAAHLGGAAIGFVAWLFWRHCDRPADEAC